MLQRRIAYISAALFNFGSLAAVPLIIGRPDSSLWLRNILFVRPVSLAGLEREIVQPPLLRRPVDHSALGSQVIRRVQAACLNEASDCHPKALAAYLASLERFGGCGVYSTRNELVDGVLAGGGCCSDIVKAYLVLAGRLEFSAREVHIPSHTSVEYWDKNQRRWVWIDPFIGYQAISEGQFLSHLDVYKRFLSGLSVQFRLIESPLNLQIRPVFNYADYRPIAYQAVFYTQAESFGYVAIFSDFIAGVSFPKALHELVLYLTIKPSMLMTSSGFNLFIIMMARGVLWAWIFAWLSSSMLLAFMLFSTLKRRD
jgi:hypothetical protein